jgi:hypothetical protein
MPLFLSPFSAAATNNDFANAMTNQVPRRVHLYDRGIGALEETTGRSAPHCVRWLHFHTASGLSLMGEALSSESATEPGGVAHVMRMGVPAAEDAGLGAHRSGAGGYLLKSDSAQ